MKHPPGYVAHQACALMWNLVEKISDTDEISDNDIDDVVVATTALLAHICKEQVRRKRLARDNDVAVTAAERRWRA